MIDLQCFSREKQLIQLWQLQAADETFLEFYVRLKNLAEEVDLCLGDPVTCDETQLNMVMLMSVKEEEIVQRLISLNAGAPLQDVVTCCHSFEAARDTSSTIQSAPSQLCAIFTYKRVIDATRQPNHLSQRSQGIEESPQLLMQPNPVSVAPNGAGLVSALP